MRCRNLVVRSSFSLGFQLVSPTQATEAEESLTPSISAKTISLINSSKVHFRFHPRTRSAFAGVPWSNSTSANLYRQWDQGKDFQKSVAHCKSHRENDRVRRAGRSTYKILWVNFVTCELLLEITEEEGKIAKSNGPRTRILPV
jgi:hypothetical protein